MSKVRKTDDSLRMLSFLSLYKYRYVCVYVCTYIFIEYTHIYIARIRDGKHVEGAEDGRFAQNALFSLSI